MKKRNLRASVACWPESNSEGCHEAAEWLQCVACLGDGELAGETGGKGVMNYVHTTTTGGRKSHS